MRAEQMEQALIKNRSRYLLCEVKRINGRSSESDCSIDGVNDDKDQIALLIEQSDICDHSHHH